MPSFDIDCYRFQNPCYQEVIVGLVALCRGFYSCRRHSRGVAVDFGSKPSGWFINELSNPNFIGYYVRR